IGKLARCPDRGGKARARQEQAVGAAAVDLGDQLRLARPEQHLAPVARQRLGERGAPGARADHTDPLALGLSNGHAFTPAPRTGSAPASSGQRGRAAKSSGSACPSASRSTPAQAIIAALSVQSESGGATKRSP